MSIFIDNNFRQLLCLFFWVYTWKCILLNFKHSCRTLRSIEHTKLVSVANKRGDNVEMISRKYRSHGRFAPLSRKSFENTGEILLKWRGYIVYHIFCKERTIFLKDLKFYWRFCLTDQKIILLDYQNNFVEHQKQ